MPQKIAYLTDVFSEHRARLERYERYQKLFEGKHHEVFGAELMNKLAENFGETIYIVVNLPKVVSLVSADLLFGEPPEIRAIGADEEELQELLHRSQSTTLFYELALSASVKGDAFLKVYVDEEGVRLGLVNASFVFPEFDLSGRMVSATISYFFQKDGQRFLYKETHAPGLVRFEVIDASSGLRVPVSEFLNTEEEVETGLNEIPIIHIPNFRSDADFYGISDYVDIESIVDEINNRFSQNARILDKHADPKLLLPEDLFNELTKRGGPIRKEEIQVIGLPDGATNKPSYLTWDAQLSSSFEHIKMLLTMFMTVTEIAPDVIGLSEGGGKAESGRALRFRILRTLAKVRRKALYFDAGIKKALRVADALSRYAFGKPIGESFEIVWKDGLPQDPVESAQVEQIRTGGKPTTSVISAIRRLDGLTLEGAVKELERMRKEEANLELEDLISD